MAAAAGQVTPENVGLFTAELRARVGSVTLAQTIYKLRRIADLLDPARGFDWLRDIERDLAFEAIPKSRTHQLVDGPKLLEAGLVMVKEGELGEALSSIKRARLVRNGLMIALLALYPIRLKNFASLELAMTLRRERDAWWISLSRTETKSKRPDVRRIHEIIEGPLELYVGLARPILRRKVRDWSAQDCPKDIEMHTGALWIDSNLGRTMSYSGVEEAVAESTREAFGMALRPHMFRACVATTAYVTAGDHPHLASALLQHSDARVTQKHYNKASSVQAAKVFAELISDELTGVHASD